MSRDIIKDPAGKDLVESLRKASMWGNIHRLAEQDPELQEQLDKIVVYYRLKYEQRRR
jgi:hypothetical protein